MYDLEFVGQKSTETEQFQSFWDYIKKSPTCQCVELCLLCGRGKGSRFKGNGNCLATTEERIAVIRIGSADVEPPTSARPVSVRGIADR